MDNKDRDDQDQCILDEADHADMMKMLEKVFPEASPEMKQLMRSQMEALACTSPTNRR